MLQFVASEALEYPRQVDYPSNELDLDFSLFSSAVWGSAKASVTISRIEKTIVSRSRRVSMGFDW